MEEEYELSIYEKLMYNISQYGDLIVGASVFLQGKDVLLTEEIVKKALIILQERHPFLRAYIYYKKTNKKNTIRVLNNNQENYREKINLNWINLANEKFSREKIIGLVEKFNSKVFNHSLNGDLMWRYQVIAVNDEHLKYCLTLVMPIFITDGTSSSTVLVESVNIINALLTNTECHEMIVKRKIISSIHSICEKDHLIGDEQLDNIDKYNHKKSVIFKFADKLRSNNESGPKINYQKFNKEITENIIRKCKLNNTKVTGFLTAIFFNAIKALYEENNLKIPCQISCSIPASLRIRYKTKIDPEDLGYHVAITYLETYENDLLDSQDIWKYSISMNKLIGECTSKETGSLYCMTHNSKLHDKFNTISEVPLKCLVKRLAHYKNNSDLVLSNLGNLINDSVKLHAGPLSIEEIYFCDIFTSNPNITSAFGLFFSTWKGELMMCSSSNRSGINLIYSERLLELFNKILLQSLE